VQIRIRSGWQGAELVIRDDDDVVRMRRSVKSQDTKMRDNEGMGPDRCGEIRINEYKTSRSVSR
jgi:hypothetical protein